MHMRRSLPFLLLLALATGSSVGRADAATVALAPIRDATLIEAADGTLADGSGPSLRVGDTNQSVGATRRALLLFDVHGAVPAGSVITDATLILHASGGGPPRRLVTVHPMLADWGEGGSVSLGGSGAQAAPGDPTWLHRFHNPADPASSPAWSRPGGDFAADASARAEVGDSGFHSWRSAGLVGDLQGWLDDPGTQRGWILLGDEDAPQSVRKLDSRENENASFRPLLIVEFEPPHAGGQDDEDPDED